MREVFDKFTGWVTTATGTFWAFGGAVISILIWLALGPFTGWSDTWQLYANTGTTIITFLMVFLIQHTQNRDTAAIMLKLDALIAASRASNKFIGCEAATEEDIEALRRQLHNRQTEGYG